MTNRFWWCFQCERVFRIDGVYGGKKVLIGKIGSPWCPLCGASYMETLDWETFIFGLAASCNYPDQPEDGAHYPLHPVI